MEARFKNKMDEPSRKVVGVLLEGYDHYLNPDNLEFEPEIDYWKNLRNQAAIAAMQGLLSNTEVMKKVDKLSSNYHQKGVEFPFAGTFAILAKDHADKLIEELQK